jgi:hypothetical protein
VNKFLLAGGQQIAKPKAPTAPPPAPKDPDPEPPILLSQEEQAVVPPGFRRAGGCPAQAPPTALTKGDARKWAQIGSCSVKAEAQHPLCMSRCDPIVHVARHEFRDGRKAKENGIVEDKPSVCRPCELVARLLREKCWEQFVRSDGCRYESDPAVVGDASKTKVAARRWKTSGFATTFVKRKVDRFECRNHCSIDSCEDGARKNAHTSRIEVSYEAPSRRQGPARR